MLNLILGMALFGVGHAPPSDWRLVEAGLAPYGARVYSLVDRATIHSVRGRTVAAFYWVSPDTGLDAQLEFDCLAGRFRPIAGRLRGQVRLTGIASGWQPRGSHAALFAYVCGFDPAAGDSTPSFGAGNPVRAVQLRQFGIR